MHQDIHIKQSFTRDSQELYCFLEIAVLTNLTASAFLYPKPTNAEVASETIPLSVVGCSGLVVFLYLRLVLDLGLDLGLDFFPALATRSCGEAKLKPLKFGMFRDTLIDVGTLAFGCLGGDGAGWGCAGVSGEII